MTTEYDELHGSTTEYDKLLFGVRKSIRYHDRRVSFFERSHEFILFFVLIGGFAGMAFALTSAFPSNEKLGILPGLIVSTLAAIDLVVGTSRKAHLHDKMKLRFQNLEIDMTHGSNKSGNTAKWKKKRLQIEAEEPPVLRVLDALCHNELLRAMGYPKMTKDYASVSTFQRVVSHFFDWHPEKL